MNEYSVSVLVNGAWQVVAGLDRLSAELILSLAQASGHRAEMWHKIREVGEAKP